MNDEIKLQTLQVGPLAVNCYILSRAGEALVIDPGADEDEIEDALCGLRLTAILLTHAHFDHIAAVDELMQAHPQALLYCSAECARLARDPALNLSLWAGGLPCELSAPEATPLSADQTTTIAGIALRVFEVPGHMPGQLCYHVPALNALFSGDTVFAGSIGRSDFPGGDGPLLLQKTLHMLRTVPAQTAVYPGHGPASTAARELATNPFLNEAE